MKLEYVGFRPVISQHGISFKQGKDDKYTYLPYVYEIVVALNHNYETDKTHSYNIKLETANIDKLVSKVLEHFPNLEDEVAKKLELYKEHLNNEIEDVKNRHQLNDIEKSIFLTNLDLMRDYRLKRAKNKIFYYYSILTIVEIIKTQKIKEINLPFSEKFWHILKTLQGVLSSEKISSSVKTKYENSNLTLKFVTSIY